MSWDRIEYTEYAVCACGKGKVVRHAYSESDDWNRSRDGIISESILCTACKENFHIEHYVKYVFCLPWKGDGRIDRTYLVPNGLSIPQELSQTNFQFKLDEQIVATYSLEEIANAKADMLQNKYSTRLKQKSSKEIVELFFKKYKKKSLSPIIHLLNDIEAHYQKYRWTPQRLSEFKLQETIKIQENEASISNVLNQSFELDFKRSDDI